jgi:hypothetical protein
MMKMHTRILTSFALLGLYAASAQACPNCKDGVAHYDAANGRVGASTNGLSAGFNYSVLFMLGVPAAILGVGGMKIRKLAREGRLPEF